jgi:hypothetical protein
MADGELRMKRWRMVAGEMVDRWVCVFMQKELKEQVGASDFLTFGYSLYGKFHALGNWLPQFRKSKQD